MGSRFCLVVAVLWFAFGVIVGSEVEYRRWMAAWRSDE